MKLLTGNPGKRKLNRGEPKGRPGVPPCPPHLTGVARDAWHRLGRRLATLRVITEGDAEALELLCSAYAEYRATLAVVTRRGRTYSTRTANGIIVRKRPEAAIASEAWWRVKSMLIEFGLTPSARTRITAADATDETGDQVETFLFGRRA
jgi:P27 family predicted phage terminase small subunit